MSARPKLILVVDDNQPQRYATAHALQDAGFRIVEAESGESALARVAAESPDLLVLLNVQLPDMSGAEICRRLKARPATARIPVLHIAPAVASAQDRNDALKLGADGYLTYPVDDVALLSAVKTLLRMAAAEEERARLWVQVDAQAELLKAVITASPDHLYLFDREGRYAYANPAGAAALHLEPQQMIGKSWRELGFPEEVMGPVQRQVERVFATGDRYHGESEFPIGSERRSYDYVLSPVLKDGAISAVLCAVRDITDRKLVLESERAARQAAEAAEGRIAGILESITDAFFTLDRQWRFSYVNREAERLLRQSRKHLLGRVVWELFPNADPFRRRYETALEENRAVHFEEFYGPLGDVWFEVHAYPGPEGISIYFRDVTARKRDEAALHAAKAVAEHSVAQLRTVVEAMNEALIVFNPQGELVLSNPAFDRMYDLGGNVPKSRMEFQRALELRDDRGRILPPSEWPSVRAFRGETLIGYELHVRNVRTGREFDSRHTAIPVRDASGNILLAVLTVEDITRAKQSEAEQRLAKDLAETSAAQLSTTIESMAEGVLAVDPELRVLLKNAAFARLYGVSAAADLPDRLLDFLNIVTISEMNGRRLPPEELPIRRALAGEVVRDCELRLVRRATGKEIIARYNASPVTDAHGNVLMAVLTVEDITERRAIEEALRQSDERVRAAAVAAEIGVWTWDVRGGQIMVGANWKRLFGVSPQSEVTYETWVNALHPEDRQRAHEALAAAARDRQEFNVEYRVMWPDGQVHWIVDRGRGVYDEAGQCLSMSGVNVDITNRKRTEEALRQHAEELEKIMDVVPAAIWVSHDSHCQNIVGNRTANEFYEAGPGENVSASVVPVRRFLRGGRELTSSELPMQQAVATGNDVRDVEFDVELPSGRRINLWGSATPLRDAEGRVRGCVAAFVNMTARKQTEQELFETSQRLEAVMKAVPVGVSFSSDPSCQSITGNPAALAQFGVGLRDNLSASAPDECAAGRQVRFFIDGRPITDAELPLQRAVAENREIPPMELEVELADGRRWFAEASGAPIRDAQGNVIAGVAVTLDITERKQAEQALRNTEKLATAGRLAAVLAHEINNPMAAVTNLIYLLSAEESLGPVARSYVELAQQELARIAHITKQMLGFCREPAAPEIVRFSDVLDGVLDLYDPRIHRAHVVVDRRYDFQEPVRTFASEVRQVFSNLVVNALDAMGDAGGTLRLRVRRAQDTTGRCGVRIVIADTGPGIAPANRKRIFEPFFTTKGERGTGLGLWVTQGIIQKHGGTMRVRSSTRAGRSGTCFSIFLPCEVVRTATAD